MLKPLAPDLDAPDLPALRILDERLRFLSAWTIHHANHRPRQQRRAQGRRAPGELRVDVGADDRALLPRARPQRPRRGQAAWRALAPRDPLPARLAKPRPAPEFPRLRRDAKLSQPDQGQDPGRLLDRVGGARRRDHRLRVARAGLSHRARQDGRGRPRPLRRADRAMPSSTKAISTKPDRGLQARHPQLLVDRRLQPPEPRRDLGRPHVRALRRDLCAAAAGARSSFATARSSALPSQEYARAQGLARRPPQRRLRRDELPGRRGMACADRRRPRQGRRRLPQGA